MGSTERADKCGVDENERNHSSSLRFLRFDHVGGLRSARTSGDFEFNGFPFAQSSVSRAYDCRVVDKYVGATFVPDEAVTFGIIKPFDLTLHVVSFPKFSCPRTAVFCCFNTLRALFCDIY
jgi:hypothetical protein